MDNVLPISVKVTSKIGGGEETVFSLNIWLDFVHVLLTVPPLASTVSMGLSYE